MWYKTVHLFHFRRTHHPGRTPIPTEETCAKPPRAADGAPADARVRALAVLEALASAGQPYTLSQLAARLHIPKATLLRLIESLETRGCVIHMPDSRGHDRGIALGPRAAQFALAALSNNTFTRGCRSGCARSSTCSARPATSPRSTATRCCTSNASRRSSRYGSKCDPARAAALHGERQAVPVAAECAGAQRDARAAHAEEDDLPDADRCAVARGRLDRLARGVGIDNEEFVRGMVAVAVPVKEAESGRVLAALAVADRARDAQRPAGERAEDAGSGYAARAACGRGRAAGLIAVMHQSVETFTRGGNAARKSRGRHCRT